MFSLINPWFNDEKGVPQQTVAGVHLRVVVNDRRRLFMASRQNVGSGRSPRGYVRFSQGLHRRIERLIGAD
jgi:hypothetical protein